MKIIALNAGLHVDRVMVDSGAAHSACPFDYPNELEIPETQRKIQLQTASGELLKHHVEKLVPLRTLSWESRIKSLMLKVRLQLCLP